MRCTTADDHAGGLGQPPPSSARVRPGILRTGPHAARAALERHLRQALPWLLQGPLSAQLAAGGRSNLTYLLTDGRARWVLRRPPLGHVLETAHDMGREHRLLAALSPTDVPVPNPLLLAGPDVIGAPFYVMDFANGQVLRDRVQLARLHAAAATALADELIDVLVRRHRLDPEHVGLGDLGRPAGYLERPNCVAGRASSRQAASPIVHLNEGRRSGSFWSPGWTTLRRLMRR